MEPKIRSLNLVKYPFFTENEAKTLLSYWDKLTCLGYEPQIPEIQFVALSTIPLSLPSF